MSTRVIAVISQKGGSGKSTLSINIASAAHKRGLKVAIADTDTQQSVYRWYKRRAQKHPMPVVKPVFASGIAEFLEKSRRLGLDLAIIDTAPNSDHESIAIADAADLILIPTAPSLMDITALARTYNVVRATQKPAFAVLNKCPPRGSRIDQARRALQEGFKFQVAQVQIGERVAAQDAYAAGATVHEFEPDGLSAAEFDALFREISRHPAIDFPLTAARIAAKPKPAPHAEKAKAHV